MIFKLVVLFIEVVRGEEDGEFVDGSGLIGVRFDGLRFVDC